MSTEFIETKIGSIPEIWFPSGEYAMIMMAHLVNHCKPAVSWQEVKEATLAAGVTGDRWETFFPSTSVRDKSSILGKEKARKSLIIACKNDDMQAAIDSYREYESILDADIRYYGSLPLDPEIEEALEKGEYIPPCC